MYSLFYITILIEIKVAQQNFFGIGRKNVALRFWWNCIAKLMLNKNYVCIA